MMCSDSSCSREARMALKMSRPTRGDLRVTIFADDRTAPKTAQPFCKAHGIATVSDLLGIVVGEDGPTLAERKKAAACAD